MTVYLRCACCDCGFRGEPDPQRDEGFGHCPACTVKIAEKNEREWVKAEEKFAAALNPTNRAKFLAMETYLRRGLLLEAMEEGVITWEIRRG